MIKHRDIETDWSNQCSKRFEVLRQTLIYQHDFLNSKGNSFKNCSASHNSSLVGSFITYRQVLDLPLLEVEKSMLDHFSKDSTLHFAELEFDSRSLRCQSRLPSRMTIFKTRENSAVSETFQPRICFVSWKPKADAIIQARSRFEQCIFMSAQCSTI